MSNIFDRKIRDYTFLVSFFFSVNQRISQMGEFLVEHFLIDLTWHFESLSPFPLNK